MAQSRYPVMRHHADGDNTGAGQVPVGETVPVQHTGSQWHPTVTMLLGILVLEVAAFAALRYAFAQINL